MTTVTADETGKVTSITEYATQAGWTHEKTKRSKELDAVKIKFNNGDEWFEVRFDGNSCKEQPVISDGSTLKYVRNIAALKRHIAASEDERLSVFAAKARATKTAAERKEARTPKRRKLNFTADTPDAEILEGLLGRKLVWQSHIDKSVVSEDRVHREKNTRHYHLATREGSDVPSLGDRILHFVGDFGFRAVSLDAILAVR